jgi:hypothetical protein
MSAKIRLVAIPTVEGHRCWLIIESRNALKNPASVAVTPTTRAITYGAQMCWIPRTYHWGRINSPGGTSIGQSANYSPAANNLRSPTSRVGQPRRP